MIVYRSTASRKQDTNKTCCIDHFSGILSFRVYMTVYMNRYINYSAYISVAFERRQLPAYPSSFIPKNREQKIKTENKNLVSLQIQLTSVINLILESVSKTIRLLSLILHQ